MSLDKFPLPVLSYPDMYPMNDAGEAYVLSFYLTFIELPVFFQSAVLIMQRGYEFNTLFIRISGVASTICIAAVILPNPG